MVEAIDEIYFLYVLFFGKSAEISSLRNSLFLVFKYFILKTNKMPCIGRYRHTISVILISIHDV